jgi:hypothetical protein
VKRIDDHQTGYLWDPWSFLEGKRRRLLEQSWAGVMRRFLFEEFPVEQIGAAFAVRMGRPSKELYTMLGALVLQQINDLSDEEVTATLAFDQRWHFALDIVGEGDADKYVCERTLRQYRRIAIEQEVDTVLFESLTDKLLKAFGVDVSKQRLDSTHIVSNMRELRRTELFAQVIEKFLRKLECESREHLEQVDPVLRKRYVKKGSGGCFSKVKPSEAKRTLQQMAEDVLWLVERFKGDALVGAMRAYQLLCRVLEEQCEVVGGKGEAKRVQVKEPKEVSANSLQNPSDGDATYDAHKGQGYQVQIMETYRAEEDEKDETVPDLITYVEVEAASQSDVHAVEPAIEATQRRDCAPKELLADGAYGSDANVQKAAQENVELIAPANKGVRTDGDRLGLEAFEFDAQSGQVSRCPAGQEPIKTGSTPGGDHATYFDREKCCACELRERCAVKVKAEVALLNPYSDKKRRLAQRRAKENTDEFRDKYRWRAGVEATMSRYKSQTGAGRLRVRGMPSVRFAEKLKALGLNIFRSAQALAAIARQQRAAIAA